MTSEYVLRKNRKKGGKSTRGPPGIGFNLTENGDYDIAGHKLVNVKQPENLGDAVNLQYLASTSTKWTSAIDKVNDNMIKKDDSESVLKIVKPELSNMIKKDDSESVLKIVKPELSNMIKKDDSESVLKIVKPELSNMIRKDDSQSILKIVEPELSNTIKKDDSQSILKIVKPELSNMIKKDSLNLTATKRYIDIGNRRLVKTADAIDKYDVVNKGQLDIYGERLIKLETEFMKKTHYSFLQFVGKIHFIKEVDGQKAVNLLFIYFDGEGFIRLPMNVEVIKFYSTANLKDLDISTNKGTIDLSKPFIVRESDLLSFKIKKEKVNTDESLGGYNHNKPYLLSIPIFFYMLVKFSL
jgi:hypothetical protein